MSKLINLKYSFILLLVASFALLSCTDENDFEKDVVKGLPVSISFDITTPIPSQVETRANDNNDTKIEKLMLYFYDADVAANVCKPIVYEVQDLSNVTTGQGNSQKPSNKYNISVPESAGVTSGRWYIYAVANWHKGFWNKDVNIEELKDLTRAEMNEHCMLKTNHDIYFTESALLMTGKYGDNSADSKETIEKAVNLVRKGESGVNTLTLPIHLKRSVAEINFYFVNGKYEDGPNKGKDKCSFVPNSYDLYNYSLSSTMLERTGWTGTANPGTDMAYMGVNNGTENFINKEGLTVYRNVANSPYYGFQFYMPENVQKAKKTEGLTQALREKRLKELDGTNKNIFEYASDNATYVVVHGTYNGPGKNGEIVTANVDYTIHLGDFSKKNFEQTKKYDNFSVRRNTRYTFKVTVNGVNSIITEAEAASEDSETQPGAEGDVINTNGAGINTFDAHYETAIIKIAKVDAGADEFSLVLNTPKTGSRNVISVYKPSEDINNENVILPDLIDVDWIKFGHPTNDLKYKGYPKKDVGLMNVKELLRAFRDHRLNDFSDKFFVVDKDYIYLQVFVDEYFYNDLAEMNEYYRFVNAYPRSLIIATGINVSQDGNSTYTKKPLLSFTQKSIKSMYDLRKGKFDIDKDYNPFGIETLEDGYEKLGNKASKALIGAKQFTPILNNEGEEMSGSSKDNGYSNTVNIGIIKNGDLVGGSIIGEKWEKFIDVPNNKLHGIYDYGVYQFLLRNRDLNGNGIIDEGEIRWYIPAVNQYIAIWNGYHALPHEALFDKKARFEDGSEGHVLYFTSTNKEFRTVWAEEGTFGRYKYNDTEKYEYVRCIRPLVPVQNDVDKAPEKLTGNTTRSTFYYNRVFRVSGFGENAVRPSGIQVGEYTYHSQGDQSNKLPQAFEIASDYVLNKKTKEYTFTLDEIMSGHVCDDYSQENGADKGQWRIPNQRELMVMTMIFNDTHGKDYDLPAGVVSSTYYNENKSGSKNRVFFVQEGRDKDMFVTSSPDVSKFYVRPVRDVAVSYESEYSNSSFNPGYSIIK